MKEVASGIAKRFHEEQDYISRYVELLRTRLVVSSHDVWSVRGVLQSWNLVPREKNLGEARKKAKKSPAEIAEEIAYLATIKPSVQHAIEDQKALILKLFPDGESPKLTAFQSEWVEYFQEHYADALFALDSNEVLERCVEQHNSGTQDADDAVDVELLRPALDYAIGLRSARKINALDEALEELKELTLLLRVMTPEAEVNILRQGFILLMTAFDASLFDLVRAALKNRFFELIGAFSGTENKLTLKQIGAYGSLESMQNHVVEEELKRLYVKDLLNKFKKDWNVQCIEESDGRKFVDLIELVQRRNLHVHNRGVVDERYLECDPGTGKPRYNLFKLSLGATAVIDEEYWKSAITLTKTCVDRVAAWAEA